MFTPAQVRKINPLLEDASDEEITAITTEIFELAQLALECWNEERSSKILNGLLPKEKEKD